MKTIAAAVTAATMVLASQALAAPITIGGTTFAGGLADFPASVTVISGSTQEFGGIGCAEGLTGAELDTGCFNMSRLDVVRLDYGRSFSNGVGADIYFTDSRFSTDALDFSLDGATFFTIPANGFSDTGVNSAIRNDGQQFDLFAALIDLSSYGFAAGGSYSSIWLRGVDESDPIVVGLLDGTTAVPLPATLPLLVAGLGALGLVRRRRD